MAHSQCPRPVRASLEHRTPIKEQERGQLTIACKQPVVQCMDNALVRLLVTTRKDRCRFCSVISTFTWLRRSFIAYAALGSALQCCILYCCIGKIILEDAAYALHSLMGLL